ncbi:hypothetical protein [Curtobacterium oceanosedimentum]|uniref:hypothetical protein n=1 Tax=Curtobacterium oceanosedimentum TaxID=465820 RepID=UPI0033937405
MRDVVKPSAFRAGDALIIATSGAVFSALVCLSGAWLMATDRLDSPTRSIVVVVGNIAVWMCLGPCGLSMVYFYLRALQLRRREEKLGYATGPYAEGSLFVVDARTGLILRRPDEPPLRSRKDVKTARARASELFDVRTTKVGGASDDTTRTRGVRDDA